MTNYNNNDIRCGLFQSVRVNCNYIEEQYAERFPEGGELEWKEDWSAGCECPVKCSCDFKEAFWGDYNKSILPVVEDVLCGGDMDNEEELIDRFEITLNDYSKVVRFKEYGSFEKNSCPCCGEEWTDTTRCDCPNAEEEESVSPVGECSLGHKNGEFGCTPCGEH